MSRWENKHCRLVLYTIVWLLLSAEWWNKWSSCGGSTLLLSRANAPHIDHPLCLCKQSKLTIRQLTSDDIMTYNPLRFSHDFVFYIFFLFIYVRHTHTHIRARFVYTIIQRRSIYMTINDMCSVQCSSARKAKRNSIMMCRKQMRCLSGGISTHSSNIEHLEGKIYRSILVGCSCCCWCVNKCVYKL